MLACTVRCSAQPQTRLAQAERPGRWAHIGKRGTPFRSTPAANSAKTAAAAPGVVEPAAHASKDSAESVVEKYNREMAEKMGWTNLANPFEYNFDRGLYFHYVAPDLVVGSQPRHAADVDDLAKEGVTHILNLQQDKDLEYWNVSLHEISSRSAHHGMHLIRTPAVDFSPHSLRDTLPRAVREQELARAAGGKVYVHCTAGLGRSPAVAIASLYWFTDMQLDEAYAYLTGIRPCGPNKDAIRGATYDLLSNRPHEHFQHEPDHAFATLSSQDRDVIRAKLLGNH
ncbi:hypothetical protein D9Q98_005225 [Chlorella vulgaris]|uniref:Uncharacterized protein n=1 Tax=Chlorella vulgaris TaxID=3077 RepID=A0A9D4YWX5_CHLVU|nr:hypothetical protein D9Q98_005225 [Chlorella vulgaris]